MTALWNIRFALCAALTLIAPARVLGTHHARVKEAVSKSIAVLQTSQDQGKIPCVSCHHQSLPLAVYSSARLRGVPVDEERVRKHSGATFRMLSGYDFALQMPLDAFGFGYGLLVIEDAGIDTGLTARSLRGDSPRTSTRTGIGAQTTYARPTPTARSRARRSRFVRSLVTSRRPITSTSESGSREHAGGSPNRILLRRKTARFD